MEVAPRYTLLTLLTVLTAFTSAMHEHCSILTAWDISS